MAGWQHGDVVARLHDAAGYRAGKTAEIGVRPLHELDRHTKGAPRTIIFDVDAFKIIDQGRTAIPARPLAWCRNIVAMQGREGDRRNGLEAERAGESLEAIGDGAENKFVEID